MVTSPPPPPSPSAAAPLEQIAEDDKLGPFGARASVLRDPGTLRARLIGELERAAAAAAAAPALAAQSSTTAVHEARKALRRARAVLSMVAGSLPKSERRAVRAALRDARRALSTARDHAVAPETLGGLELGDEERATARRVLDNAAEAIPSAADIKHLLEEAAQRTAAQAAALAAAVPPELDWDVVAGGIAAVYEDARRARRRAKRSRTWFHTWRRRSKELVYQLDIIAACAGARTLAIRAEIDALSDQLGPAVDLVMLREFVQTHAQGLPAEDLERLRDTIDDQLAERMRDGRKAGRDAFRQKPRKFLRRLARAVARDLAPPDDSTGNADDIAATD